MRHCKPFISLLLLAGSLLLSQASAAAPPPPWIEQSHVEDLVTDNGGGSWTYEFAVFNDSICTIDPGTCYLEIGEPIIVDWELPYYADMGITGIVSPAGWDYSIETIGVANPATGWSGVATWQTPGDPYYAMFGDPNGPYGENSLTEVLHWYVPSSGDNLNCSPLLAPAITSSVVALAPPCPGIATPDTPFPDTYYVGSLGGFGFDASFAPTAAPYSSSWLTAPPQSGDPAFPFGGLPASPSITGGVPSPSALLLMTLGLLPLIAGLRRKRI